MHSIVARKFRKVHFALDMMGKGDVNIGTANGYYLELRDIRYNPGLREI